MRSDGLIRVGGLFSCLILGGLGETSCRTVTDDGPLGSTSENIVAGSRPASNDGLAAAVVQLVQGLGQATKNCTGTLISPRLVLTASHCFGDTSFPSSLLRSTGDLTCEVREHGSNLLLNRGATPGQTLGCGFVQFTDIDGNVRDSMPIQRVWVAKDWNNDADEKRVPRDVALVVLPRRATPLTAAKAPSLDVWLDAPADPASWSGHPVVQYGWGGVGAPTGCSQASVQSVAAQNPARFLRRTIDAKLADPGLTKESIKNTVPVPGPGNVGVGDQWDDLVFQRLFSMSGDMTGVAMPGDSGGPLIAFDFQQAPRVIGVDSFWACTDLLEGTFGNYWPRLANGDNVALFQGHAYEGDGVTMLGADVPNPGCSANPPSPNANDLDCDLVPTSALPGRSTFVDNCPQDFNPDQLDSDNDGIGDACDTCPGFYSRFNAVTHEEQDSNVEAEEAFAGHKREHITAATVPADVTRIMATNSASFPGDACDPNAIPAPAAGDGMFSFQSNGQATDVEGNDRGGRLPAGCNANSNSPFCGASESDATINQRPFGYVPPGRSHGSTPRQGFRWCSCPPGASGAECEKTSHCTRDAKFYEAPGISNWQPVTIEREATNGLTQSLPAPEEMSAPIGDAPSYGTNAFVPPAYQDRWIWWNDVDALPAVPGLGGRETTIATGRFWAFTAQEADARTLDQCLAEGAGATVCSQTRKSTYNAFDITERPHTPHIPTPVGGGGFTGGVLCRSCPEHNPIVSFHYGVDPEELRLVAEAQGGVQVELTAQVSPEVLQLIGSRAARVVQAAEPSYRIGEGEPTHVVLDVSTNHILGALSSAGGQVRVYSPGARTNGGVIAARLASTQSTNANATPSGQAVALASSERAVFAVSNGQLWRANLESFNAPAWTVQPISPAPGNVHALTAVLQVGGGVLLYALEDSGRSTMRLLEITPFGSSRVVREWRKESRHTYGVASSVSGDGLLFWSSGEGRHIFTTMQVTAGAVTSSHTVSGRGTVTVPPRAEEDGIVWGETDPRTGEIVSRLTTYAKHHGGHDADSDDDDDHRRCGGERESR